MQLQKQSLQHVGQIQFKAIFSNNLLDKKIAVEARGKGRQFFAKSPKVGQNQYFLGNDGNI